MEQDYIAKTALDEMVESDRDQMLKAMVPYLPPSGQQFLSMYTKTQELMNTMSLFRNRKKSADLQAASLSGISENAAVGKAVVRLTRSPI